jgi:putative exporter of polyketide antibiotics
MVMEDLMKGLKNKEPHEWKWGVKWEQLLVVTWFIMFIAILIVAFGILWKLLQVTWQRVVIRAFIAMLMKVFAICEQL